MTKQHNLNTFNNNNKSKLNLSKVTNLFIISQSKLYMSTTWSIFDPYATHS
jgi:hypothetical protein